MIQDNQSHATVAQIIRAVCRYYNISPAALASNGRSRAISYPRQVAMYLCRTEAGHSFPHIGTHFGNRDHSTVLYGCEKIAAMAETSLQAKTDIRRIKESIYKKDVLR